MLTFSVVGSVSAGEVSCGKVHPNFSEVLICNDTSGSMHFKEMSRSEYISEFAEVKGITYDEAERIVDIDIENAIASLPEPMAWQGDTIVQNPDTTSTVYEGYFEISQSVALSSGINLELLNFSHSVGGNMYYRTDVYQRHIEKTRVQGEW